MRKKTVVFLIFLNIILSLSFISCENPFLMDLTGEYLLKENDVSESTGKTETEENNDTVENTEPGDESTGDDKTDSGNSNKTAIYKVMHYQQTTDLGSSYRLMAGETQTLAGKTGSETKAEPKSFYGFTAKSFTQETILSDGSTCVKIYYDRNKYQLSFNANGGSGTMSAQNFAFNVSGTVKSCSFTRADYYFSGWSYTPEGSVEIENGEQLTLTKNIKIYAKWTYGKNLSENEVDSLDLSVLENDCSVKISGNISASNLSKLREKILQANKNIILDLSKTTGLTVIGTGAFSNCSALTAVILPEGVSTIGAEAFYRSGIKALTLENIQTVGSNAFKYCTSLENVTIKNCTSMGQAVFYGCPHLQTAYLDAMTIESEALAECTNLTSATIGKSVKTIKNLNSSYRVFCSDSNLQSVIFENTKGWYHYSSIQIDVTNPYNNALRLRSAEVDWVRKD